MQHKEGNFKGYKDVNIYYQCWLPGGKTQAVLLISHGFAEHSGRYGNVVNYFVPKGYPVYAPDHRGHGRSGGERAVIDDFLDYIKDLKTLFDIVRKENPDAKIFLIGHSLGALISLVYTAEYQQELAGLVTSGGGSPRPDDPPLPLPSENEPLPTSFLSRDSAVIEAYVKDPLVYRGPIPRQLAVQRNSMMSKLPQLLPQIKLPVLIMAGNDISDGERSQVLYELIGSEDKTLRRYDGLRHEIFNEPEHPQVIADMAAWIIAHL